MSEYESYTEYELLNILNENGYEPSDENLDILYKDDNLLEDLLIENRIRKAEKEIKNGANENETLTKYGISAKRYEAHKHGKDAAKELGNGNEHAGALKFSEGRKSRVDAAIDNDESVDKKDTGTHESKDTGKVRGKIRKLIDTSVNKNKLDKETAEVSRSNVRGLMKHIADKYPESSTVKTEELYTEYELMQILDENGFTTTDEDVALLRESLENGSVIILEK